MRKFNENEIYSTRSACDYDCQFRFRVVRRTAKSIWICQVFTDWESKVTRRSIKPSWNGEAETVLPLGNYSMAPTLTA